MSVGRTLPVLLVLLLCIGLGYGIRRSNEGFSLSEIAPLFPSAYTGAITPEVKSCLSQPFHYLGKGCQSYVFESEDKKSVLKLFKQKHLAPPTWLEKGAWVPGLGGVVREKAARRALRVERLCASCKLAYEEMRRETGLLFVHLGEGASLGQEVVLIDKRGSRYKVALDQYAFLLQERGERIEEVFARIETEEALRTRLGQLMALVTLRCERGIADRDRSFAHNVAFHPEEPRAFFIDVGQFYHEEGVTSKEGEARDIQKRFYDLRMWVEEAYPLWTGALAVYASTLPAPPERACSVP